MVYYIDDHLGSTALVTDSNGNVLREEYRYPYGLDRKTDNPGSLDANYVYTGKELDEETGLVYFGGRYYAPEMGRWTSPDNHFVDNPVVNIDNSLSSNLYAYVRNNPTTRVDPDGRIDNSAFHENRIAYGEQYRDNLRQGPRSPAERTLETSIGVGLAGLVVGPAVLHAGVAAAPYVASAELAAGRAAYTAARVMAEKSAVEAGYVAGFGRSAGAAANIVKQGIGETGFEASIKGIEFASKVASAQAVIKGIETSQDFVNGAYMPDAPKNWTEFTGNAFMFGRDLYKSSFADEPDDHSATPPNQCQ